MDSIALLFRNIAIVFFWVFMLSILFLNIVDLVDKRKRMKLKRMLYTGSLWRNKKESSHSELYAKVMAFDDMTKIVAYEVRDDIDKKKIEYSYASKFLEEYAPI